MRNTKISFERPFDGCDLEKIDSTMRRIASRLDSLPYECTIRCLDDGGFSLTMTMMRKVLDDSDIYSVDPSPLNESSDINEIYDYVVGAADHNAVAAVGHDDEGAAIVAEALGEDIRDDINHDISHDDDDGLVVVAEALCSHLYADNEEGTDYSEVYRAGYAAGFKAAQSQQTEFYNLVARGDTPLGAVGALAREIDKREITCKFSDDLTPSGPLN